LFRNRHELPLPFERHRYFKKYSGQRRENKLRAVTPLLLPVPLASFEEVAYVREPRSLSRRRAPDCSQLRCDDVDDGWLLVESFALGRVPAAAALVHAA